MGLLGEKKPANILHCLNYVQYFEKKFSEGQTNKAVSHLWRFKNSRLLVSV